MNRVRTRTLPDITETFHFEGNSGAGWYDVPSWAQAGQLVRSESDEMIDVVIPHFHKRIAAGEVIINDMQIKRQTSRGGGGNFLVIQNGSYPRYRNVGDGSVTIRNGGYYDMPSSVLALTLPSDRTSAMQMAKAQALGKVDRTPYSFMEDALEVKKTLELLRHPLSTGLRLSNNYVTAIRKLQKKSGGSLSLIEASAQAWLGLNFGYGNVVRSSLKILEMNEHISFTKPVRRRATSLVDYSASDSTIYSSPNQFGQACKFALELKATNSAKAGIIYEVTNPIRGAMQYAGLRLKDVPQGVWAVMPYSWVVDRFIDISTALDGLSNLSDPNVHVLGAYTVTRESYSQSCRLVEWDVSPSALTLSADTLSKDVKYVTRRSWSPSVADVLPPFTLAQDARSLKDLAALTLRNLGHKP